jgi:hypothetical protein
MKLHAITFSCSVQTTLLLKNGLVLERQLQKDI